MTPVIICGADLNQPDFDYTMQELANLAEACDMEVKDTVIQKLERPVSASYVGRGKAEEIKTQGKIHDARILIVNDELTPMQIRNLGDLTDMKIIDRTALILEIFASRARSKEAKLQVQIAQLRISLPRLHTDNDKVKLDQQTGGGGGSFNSRGGGETKLEKDRRVIGKRISILKKELKDIEEKQSVTRKQRDASGLKSVALVGYTNAGKSTTMNGLLRACGKDDDKQVFEKDMLFATLDTSVRRLHFKDNKDFLISDTVGFVSHLPHQLVQAFKSTLSEAAKADLLVQVIDVSDPNYRDMIKTTEETLKEIGVENIPMIYAFNKADLTEAPYPEILGNQITYSAKDPASIEKIVELIKENIFKDDRIVTFKIPFSEGRYLDELNVRGTVLETTYEEDGTVVSANVSPELHSRLSRFEMH
ncbi:GTPase HflX [Ligilactobacillus ruminis]|uniref:GTPase HflX n=1 Tax=Ligilactobacillus ruminis TaxID=1623 RepID=A0A8B2Z9N8_9LACO|nr:GTPase HflX [Ligilactobacillus ruminis]RGK48225.1 GTPase HflX [Ligilactobacillus ruminis]